MTFSADQVADIQAPDVEAVDLDGQLRALLARGYRFIHPTGRAGQLVAVVGVRAHHEVIDVVCLRGEGEAKAVRMSADEADILAPRHPLWQRTGRAAVVLAELLALADDRPEGASSILATTVDTGRRSLVHAGSAGLPVAM
jgi:hypothetical protein